MKFIKDGDVKEALVYYDVKKLKSQGYKKATEEQLKVLEEAKVKAEDEAKKELEILDVKKQLDELEVEYDGRLGLEKLKELLEEAKV